MIQFHVQIRNFSLSFFLFYVHVYEKIKDKIDWKFSFFDNEKKLQTNFTFHVNRKGNK